tara:strand:+ start:321 stop:650 length:330 start_codon:yes stop_codon:yes gene_type:complete
MAYTHRGIRQYQGDESGNVGLGQLGFKALTSAGNTGDGNFFMIKVVGGAATAVVTLELETHQGDGPTGSSVTITGILTGEVIYGAFKKITSTSQGSNIVVLCYHGNTVG